MRHNLLLSLALAIFGLSVNSQNLIVNGDFSGSGGWTTSLDFYYGTTYSNCPCGTPPCYGYAYMSTTSGQPGNNLSGALQQTITLSQTYSSANFSYCWNATSTENASGNDDLQVRIHKINPSSTIIVNTHFIIGNISGSTVNYVLTDPNFLQAGAQLEIQFLAGTNASLATTIRVDDVSLIGCVTPSAPSGLTVQSTSCNSVNLSWNPVSGSGITYQVFKNQTSCSFSFGSVFGPTSSTSATVTGLSPNTTYYFVVYASNSCGQSTNMSNCITATTLSAPATPDSIGGTKNNICQGATPYYSISPVTGASSYTWTVPSGWTIGSGQGSTGISTTAGSASGQISVTANSSGCGNSSPQTLNVNVVPVPTTPVITASPNPICTGQTSTLTVTNPCTGCVYNWSNGGSGITHVVSNGSFYAWASVIACNSFSIYTSSNSNTVVVNMISINISPTTTNATCGQSNGSATATPSGGSSPYSYAWSNGQSTQTITGLAAGTYSVTVTDANSCTGTKQNVPIAQSQPPVATISSSSADTSGAPNCTGTATVTASGGLAPYSYKWSTTPPQTTATATGLCGNTTYTVTVTDANGCTTTKPVTILVGINEMERSRRIAVFPNPANGSFNIVIESITQEKIQIKILNVLGETIYTSTPETATGKYLKEINLGNTAKGIYVVELNTGEKTFFQKLILK